jgi:sulfur carrier protein
MSRNMMRDLHMRDASAALGAPHKITLNGMPFETAAQTLAELLVEAGFVASKVATALNGEFVAERQRDKTRLSHGDRVEIVAPRQGG